MRSPRSTKIAMTNVAIECGQLPVQPSDVLLVGVLVLMELPLLPEGLVYELRQNMQLRLNICSVFVVGILPCLMLLFPPFIPSLMVSIELPL